MNANMILGYDKIIVRLCCKHTKMFHLFQDVAAEEEPKDEQPKDERSVEDLLSFINGTDGGISCHSP